MGLLGDKLLKAGVVTQETADRLHRQEIIEQERRRKAEERREAQQRQRKQEDRLYDIATMVATMAIKSVALEALGFTKDEQKSILTHDPPPTLELFHKLGCMTPEIMALIQSDVLNHEVEKERDRLLKDPKFLQSIDKDLLSLRRRT
jgi:hypothetical protein